MVDVKKAVAAAIILMVVVIAGFTFFENSSTSKETESITVTSSPVIDSGSELKVNQFTKESVESDKQKSLKDESNQQAPNFTLKDLEGEEVSLSDYEGKIIFVNFWATWCGPCKREIPGFIELQNKYKDDLVILGISTDRRGTKDRVAPFAKNYNINFPVLFSDGKVEKDYGGIRAIPTTFILDRELDIAQKIRGYRPDTFFEQAIKSLL
ncbi:MAG: TlpA disulfide reductase family protein [Candidatus Marinimicrobia bacterium]|jgi:cytochrome c biogenesis protein CcmG/thiol:disulfide interchange protein DsbE|nr:TlpA disulfide reductase family protein [Candidatus Neomarinimicrobiota bacterium]MDP7654058.1 TlpA disulfide reductase family protein [Candidatus Neomarinimicrobiota bacterium]|tara:strand:- start:2577 stop:3206 length:630 start_codon:yes stop_codon:yes gene_type:complete